MTRKTRAPLVATRLLAVAAAVIAMLPVAVQLSPGPAVAQTGPAIGPNLGTVREMELTRAMDEWYAPDLPGTSFDQASVTVSQTGDLTRQRVSISWSGLRPTVGQGFPVVILQCWGTPAEVEPERCWTNNRKMDRAVLFDATDYRSSGRYGQLTPTQAFSTFGSVPFHTRAGDRYAWAEANQQQVDEFWPGGGHILGPPLDDSPDTQSYHTSTGRSLVTQQNGTGDAAYELLPAFDVPSLGCSATGPCSLVVIPIGRTHCQSREQLVANGIPVNTASYNATCVNPTSASVVGTFAWETPTNWSRRFAFPLTFRPTPDVCRFDDRRETSLTGSPLAFQLMASWRPKFCTDQELFRLGYTEVGEGDVRRQFVANRAAPRDDGVNAALTSQPISTADDPVPVVHAPVAVAGFTVAYSLYATQNGTYREVADLRLNPRVLAKLITQSYRAWRGGVGVGMPAPVVDNPLHWLHDPELLALNPQLAEMGLPLDFVEPFPVLVQGDLDLVRALTSYLAADPQARAWLSGTPDEWGMRVNPHFQDWQLPADQFELRDAWVAPDTDPDEAEVSQYGEQIVFNLLANLAANLREATIATMNNWPTSTRNWNPNPLSPGENRASRTSRQDPPGGVLAIIGTADAAQFQLRTAALETAGGVFVRPDPVSMEHAVRPGSTVLDERTGTLTLDHLNLDQRAYPGTMPIYTVVPTQGLNREQADNYATFLEYAAGPGQVPGTEAGQLPAGYLPLTGPLREQARAAAEAVREQAGEVPPPPPSLGDDPAGPGGTRLPPLGPPGPGGGPVDPSEPGPADGDDPAAAGGSPSPLPEAAAARAGTQTSSSWLARWALPILLGLGLLAGVLAPVAAVAVQPGHPVRRRAVALVRRLRARWLPIRAGG